MPARNGARDPVDGSPRTRSPAQLPDARDLDQETHRSGALVARPATWIVCRSGRPVTRSDATGGRPLRRANQRVLNLAPYQAIVRLSCRPSPTRRAEQAPPTTHFRFRTQSQCRPDILQVCAEG